MSKSENQTRMLRITLQHSTIWAMRTIPSPAYLNDRCQAGCRPRSSNSWALKHYFQDQDKISGRTIFILYSYMRLNNSLHLQVDYYINISLFFLFSMFLCQIPSYKKALSVCEINREQSIYLPKPYNQLLNSIRKFVYQCFCQILESIKLHYIGETLFKFSDTLNWTLKE